ncbi:hypothetical protein CRN32_07080 [Vibrio vulnificus]|uniref:CapA family protein n=1 Tax=Vibrio vulnificus TaxID=672 RepID=UPI000C9E31CB|nr:CapA family protein [Vibrio vulnificus]MCA3986511.1 CapA family protein [Vibrio vulnificus]MDK2603651.1 CapA family protein [Vibrio vulnificus]MDK2624341.1 CapA family protein [Vibrio vulnificus]MDK2719636.1 CapA family protein [Vibrio vulnificus]PNG63360.1 hypothetical protein SC81_16565 [Vibrio vulnificus]
MKICFTGDVFLGGDLVASENSDIIKVNAFTQADIRVINLEQAVSDNDVDLNKCTLFTATSTTINRLKELEISAANLAHNHIQDKGLSGIVDTVSSLKANSIGTFGAGADIVEAKEPFEVVPKIKLFGYCDFDKPYLKQIVVAEESTPGVNPLRLKSILSDLDSLDSDEKAILYFHWGREHINFPHYSEICLVKKLLEDERVLTVIGMHCHRVQGEIKHNGKTAYMSLGNFLFPNFYIAPPTRIHYPKDSTSIKHKTYYYHDVFHNTYKLWKWINRVSLIVVYDTEKKSSKATFVKQSLLSPEVNELKGIELLIAKGLYVLMSQAMTWPKSLYDLLHKVNVSTSGIFWRAGVWGSKIKQLGIKNSINIAVRKLSGKKL